MILIQQVYAEGKLAEGDRLARLCAPTTAARNSQPVQAPWILPEVPTADWLRGHGFRGKHTLQASWSDNDKAKFRQGILDWESGKLPTPSENTDLLYFLSHHVMERRFSAKACRKMLRSQLRELRKRGELNQLIEPVESEEDPEYESDEGDTSEDEVVLPTPSGMCHGPQDH